MSKLLAAVMSMGATALVLAATGAADTSTTIPYSSLALNECNGESVEVQGMIHMTEGSSVDANGTHYHITMNLVGVKGIAPLSGARYVESDTTTQTSNFQFDGASEANAVETRILTRLGEDGTPDDFRYHLRFHMTMNANGVLTVDRTESEIDCN